MLWLPIALGCAFHAPPEPPPLVAVQGHVPTVPVPGDRVVVGIRAGTAYDPPGREGLAWVTAKAIAIDAGVEVAPTFGKEVVTFSVRPADLPALAKALAAGPSDAAIASAREAAAGIAGGLTCDAVGRAAWDAWIYAGHPYGHGFGRTSVIPTITPNEVRAFQALRYVRGGAAIGVPAGFDAQDALDVLPAALSRPVTPTTLPPLGADGVLVVTAPVEAPCAVVGNRVTDGGATQEAWVASNVVWGAWLDPRLAEGERTEPAVRAAMPLDVPLAPDAAGTVATRWLSLRTVGLDAATFEPARAAAAQRIADHAGEHVVARLLLDLPPISPVADPAGAIAQADRDAVNRALAALVDPAGVRVVVVTPDPSPFRTPEGNPIPGVLSVVTAEELLR